MRYFVLLSGFMAAMYVHQLLQLILDAILAPVFKSHIGSVNFFGLNLMKQDGVWKSSAVKFTPIIQHTVLFNRNAPEGIRDRSRILRCITCTVELLVGIGVCTLILLYFRNRENNLFRALANGFAMGMVFFALQSIVIYTYTFMVLMKRLGGYTHKMIQRLRAGEDFAALDLKPADQLGFKKVTKAEKILYYGLYMGYLEDTDNYEAMRAPSHEIMSMILEREYIAQETLTYYYLLFFFSEVEPNRQMADIVFNKIKGVITTDTDSNAKRMMAYYAFNIYRDVAGAERFVSEGYAALGRMTGITASTGRLERKMLDRISSRIALEKANPNTQFPISDNRIM